MTIVLVGPTAVGKSRLAVALARQLAATGRPAEVVSADSMLVYRGMDIGTAKPTAAERGGVRHHLIDIMTVRETATVAEFQRLARAAIADCRSRGALPILVGGSALYIRAIVDEFEFPGTDPALRSRLEADLAAVGPEQLHARLSVIDPGAAAQIVPQNGRRIVRALEVVELTGRSFKAALPPYRYVLPGVLQIGLDIDRPRLHERIAARVDAMWAAGLVAEVRRLAEEGLREGLTASRALGYRQVLAFLSGEITEQEAYAETIAATRRFARRQDSWFRRDPRIRWLTHDRSDLVDRAWELADAALRPVVG
jgi:tRNA dimethylallyltransferase